MNNKKNVFQSILLFFLSIFLITTTGCSDDNSTPSTEVVAAFSSSNVVANTGESINFIDQSTGEPISWSWAFEGGDPSTSNEQNPTVKYSDTGVFDVSLTVTSQSKEDILIREDYITVTKEVIANFSTNTTTIPESGSILFSDESTGDPIEWNWTFEGGTPSTSNEQNPEVVYDKPGVYSVSLAVSNGSTTNTLAEERLISVTCTGIYCEPVFSTYNTSDIVYGVDSDGHKMILYEPEGDSRVDRPVIALMGGGGFEGTNLDLLEPLAINLVKHGIVVALLEYRIIDTDDGTTELINAQQDCRTAVRYLKKEAESLGINPDQVFIGGNGSGAFAGLFHAYTDESDLSTAELNAINGLGGLEGEAQGNSGFSSEVAGVVSLAGGMYASLESITNADVPIYAIHGTADAEVPYDREDTNPITYGSKSITEKVASVGLTSHLFTLEDGSHTAPRESSDEYILELMYFIRDIIQ